PGPRRTDEKVRWNLPNERVSVLPGERARKHVSTGELNEGERNPHPQRLVNDAGSHPSRRRRFLRVSRDFSPILALTTRSLLLAKTTKIPHIGPPSPSNGRRLSGALGSSVLPPNRVNTGLC